MTVEADLAALVAEIEARDRLMVDEADVLVRRILAELKRPKPRRARLRGLRSALDDLAGRMLAETDETASGALRWADTGLGGFYAAGATFAGSTFAWSGTHRFALAARRALLIDPILRASRLVDLDTDRVRRRLGRGIGQVVAGATPRPVADMIAREFSRRPMGAVTYRNGSRHGFGEYVAMMIETHSALARVDGALNQGRAQGVTVFELSDGALCGLAAHKDPLKADGLLVTADIASAYSLAHPRCQRTVTPRVDLAAPTL